MWIQANTEEELPEYLLGTCRLINLDVAKAVPTHPGWMWALVMQANLLNLVRYFVRRTGTLFSRLMNRDQFRGRTIVKGVSNIRDFNH
jgi:hypothetical protein